MRVWSNEVPPEGFLETGHAHYAMFTQIARLEELFKIAVATPGMASNA